MNHLTSALSRITLQPSALREGIDFQSQWRRYGYATSSGVRVVRYEINRVGGFGHHVDEGLHQLSWASTGMQTACTANRHWMLLPDRAMWIPSGVGHDLVPAGPSTLYCAYFPSEWVSSPWEEPTVLHVDDLVRGLLAHLMTDLTDEQGTRAQGLLLDALRPADSNLQSLVVPENPRSRRIAERVLADPARPESLQHFARQERVHERTVQRLFRRDTGLTFKQWQIRARLHASIPWLHSDIPVAEVAQEVGYSTATGYINAFRREFGTTPGAYRSSVLRSD